MGELQRKLQSVSLEKASWERKAEICEAELVETLAKVYTLQQADGVAAARPLSEDEELKLQTCMRHALDTASAFTAIKPVDQRGSHTHKCRTGHSIHCPVPTDRLAPCMLLLR